MAFGGQTPTQAAQKMQRPRSSATGFPGGRAMASVGQTGMQALHPSVHWLASTLSAPPWRSGNAGAGPLGYAIVSQPRFSRWAMVSMTNMVWERHDKSKPQ